MKKILLSILALLLAACQAEPPTAPPTAAPNITAAASTSTLSPTAEPTTTFTPAPPTSLPRAFTEEFDGSLPAWSLLQSNGDTIPQAQIQDGALVISLQQSNQWGYVLLGAEDYTDARLDALVQSRGTAPEAIGLICRYSEANGWYEFNISSDGTYSVLFGQWLQQGIATYTPIASAASEYVKPGAEQNEVGLDCQEDILWLYLNGKLFRKLDVSRFGLRQGRLGLAVSSFENLPVIAAFDRLTVSEP